MEPEHRTPSAGVPAVRARAQVAPELWPRAHEPRPQVVESWPRSAPGGSSGPGPDSARRSRTRPPSPWRRIVRTPRGAAGLGIGAAAVLLSPFAGWSGWSGGAWWPWLAGVGALIVLRLLRLDGLVRGWIWHVGGLVVVVGLMLNTGPWAWALAASIGVLIAGLVQLPLWRLAAAGAVLCLVSGAGFAIAQHRSAEQVVAAHALTQRENRGQLGAARPTMVLPVLLNAIARAEAGPVCESLLAEPVRAGFAAGASQPDCPAAVRALAARVKNPVDYAKAVAPSVRSGDLLDVDACRLSWPGRTAVGPQLGHLTIGRTLAGNTYIVTAYQPCSQP